MTLGSCAAYDAALLPLPSGFCGDGQVQAEEFCDTAIAPGKPGACLTHCSDTSNACAPERLVGSGCDRHCVAVAVTQAIDGDGCCLGDLDATEDSDCGYCGDGIVGPGETCDPPQSCVTETSCKPPDSCVVMAYTGRPDTCDARCTPSAVKDCISGDGCCPANCNRTNDGDCSDRCGDGRVDKDAGETCEPGNAQAPCPISCDDGDPCTSDLQVGSPDNCNVMCSHQPITAAMNGDGCCPAGQTAASDSDCKSNCGVGVSNANPNANACGAAASSPFQNDMQRCRDLVAAADRTGDSSCAECGCRACSYSMLQCYASGDAERDAKCTSAFECTQENACFDACYCGTGVRCVNPTGPCKQQFEAAALTPSPAAVAQCADERDCPIYLSTQYRECLQTSCYRECYRTNLLPR